MRVIQERVVPGSSEVQGPLVHPPLTVTVEICPVICWAFGLALAFVPVLSPRAAQAAETPAPPVLLSLFPPGARTGSQLTVQAIGRLQPWPVPIWTDHPGLAFRPTDTNGQYEVTLAADLPPGPHLVRAYSSHGASAPRLFVVGTNPELNPAEDSPFPNPPAPVTLPITLHGRAKSAPQTHGLPLDLTVGQTLQARGFARSLDSSAQLSLALRGADGTVLAESQAGRGGDPTLNVPIVQPGSAQLEVRIHTPDSQGAGYRVTLEAEPTPVPASATATLTTGPVERLRPLTSSRTLMIPSTTRGVVTPAGREILYDFAAQGGQLFSFVLRAGSLGSPLRPRLRVLDDAHQPVAIAPPSSDPSLVWLTPRDGDYYVAVTDDTGEGGPVHVFQLEVAPPRAGFVARVDAHALRAFPGATATLTLEVQQPVQSEDLLFVSASGLPSGVTLPPLHVIPGNRYLVLPFAVSPNAPPTPGGPFRISLLQTAVVPPTSSTASFPLPTLHVPSTALLVPESDQLWFTVLPRREEEKP